MKPAPDPAAVFGRSAPLVLEIGFGMGEALHTLRACVPTTIFCVARSMNRAWALCSSALANRSLQHPHRAARRRGSHRPHVALGQPGRRAHFFPDPWHKTKHNKRRLIQAPLVAKLAARHSNLVVICIAPPTGSLLGQMLEVLGAEPLLHNTATGFAAQPDYRHLISFRKPRPAAGTRRVGHRVFAKRLTHCSIRSATTYP